MPDPACIPDIMPGPAIRIPGGIIPPLPDIPPIPIPP